MTLEEDLLKKILKRLEILNGQMNNIYEAISDISSPSPEKTETEEVVEEGPKQVRVVFKMRLDAEHAAEQILKVYKTYGSVSIANLCDICGDGVVIGDRDDYYGWHTLPDSLIIVRTPSYKYSIVLPTPEKL